VAVFVGKIGGRSGAMLTPTNSFLLLGVVTSLPLLAKIDQCDCESENRQTDKFDEGSKGSHCATAPNFVAIGPTVAEIWRFFSIFFQDGGRPPSWIFDAHVWTAHVVHLMVFITEKFWLKPMR